ncbi:TspO/MBR family protein [Aliidiomarina halalkaliphila]|nr:TspO/MBR family protein [Aliidiomarina halalkaliphila]
MFMFRRTPSKGRQFVALFGFFAITFLTAAIGAVGSMNAPDFYSQLNLPGFAPPAWLFGPVWTILYAMMAFAAFLVWRKASWRDGDTALTLYLIQLLLNGLWSWIFFAWYSGMWAFLEIIVLWVFILLTTIAFWRHSRGAAVLMLPYLAWVTFAGVLTFSIWRLNPTVL